MQGFRGFAQPQSLSFAQPSGAVGSGLTILVGPNNGGKSTLIKALEAISRVNPVSFSEGKRNKSANDRISISLDGGSREFRILTVPEGGSETTRIPATSDRPNVYVLSSRRHFDPYFGTSRRQNREQYLQFRTEKNSRAQPDVNFPTRLFEALRRKGEFDEFLSRVVGTPPNWTIDRSDQGSYFLKIETESGFHNSDGLGDGFVSLLFVIDALYDSSPGELVVLDEPELSLHPAYQRRLGALLAEYAADRQILIATHSPYFVDLQYVVNGAHIARVHNSAGHSEVSRLSRPTASKLTGLLSNANNPHVFGLSAREVFFREDGVLVVEGQDDVVYYPRVLDQLNDKGAIGDRTAQVINDSFFGWGAGGAGNVEMLMDVFSDLGFKRVACILDSDQRHLIPALTAKFPSFSFTSIPAEDVRTKFDDGGSQVKHGLLDADGILRAEFEPEVCGLFERIASIVSR